MGRLSVHKASRACLQLLLGGLCNSHWISLGRRDSQVFSWCGGRWCCLTCCLTFRQVSWGLLKVVSLRRSLVVG